MRGVGWVPLGTILVIPLLVRGHSPQCMTSISTKSSFNITLHHHLNVFEDCIHTRSQGACIMEAIACANLMSVYVDIPLEFNDQGLHVQNEAKLLHTLHSIATSERRTFRPCILVSDLISSLFYSTIRICLPWNPLCAPLLRDVIRFLEETFDEIPCVVSDVRSTLLELLEEWMMNLVGGDFRLSDSIDDIVALFGSIDDFLQICSPRTQSNSLSSTAPTTVAPTTSAPTTSAAPTQNTSCPSEEDYRRSVQAFLYQDSYEQLQEVREKRNLLCNPGCETQYRRLMEDSLDQTSKNAVNLWRCHVPTRYSRGLGTQGRDTSFVMSVCIMAVSIFIVCVGIMVANIVSRDEKLQS